MNKSTCKRQEAMRQAMRAGELDNDWRAHIASCPECSDEFQLQRFFQQVKETSTATAVPVTAKMILIKARLQAEQEAQRKALRPLFILQTTLQILTAIVLIGAILLWPAGSHTLESVLGQTDILQSFAAQATLVVCTIAFMLSAGLFATFNSLSYRR